MTAIALPHFAPVPAPLVLHILPSSTLPIEQRMPELTMLLNRVHTARLDVLKRFDSIFKERKKASVKHLLQEPLSEVLEKRRSTKGVKMYSIDNSTVGDWRDCHLLLPGVNMENIAGLLTAAMVDTRMQGYFPMDLDYPAPWWCFSQAPPQRSGKAVKDAPILPCPQGGVLRTQPTPPLAPGTLLISPWPVFEEGWQRAGKYGAVRFHQLGVEEIELWDPKLLSQFQPQHGFFRRKVDEEAQAIFTETLELRKVREILLASDNSLFTTIDPAALLWEEADLFNRLAGTTKFTQ